MIQAHGVELRVGARLLIENATFRVADGDKVGLVGRNGAGKTTLTRVLAGEGQPAAGTVTRSGDVGYLPQDPRTGDLDVLAKDRILSARGLDQVLRDLAAATEAMGVAGPGQEPAMRRYARLEEQLHVLGGYAAESEAASLAASLGLPERVLEQPLGTLSGGQRRRIELARILFSGATTLLLDEPTNHLDADSIAWLRDYLKAFRGGVVMISHDVALLDTTVNRVLHLDATRAALDVYNVGWKQYLAQREADERRRKRERANAEKTIASLRQNAERLGAKASKAKAAHGWERRADALESSLEPIRHADRVARLALPEPAPCGRTPLMATGLSKSYGSLEVFTDVDMAVDRGSRVVILGLNGAGKTTLLRLIGQLEEPDTGEVRPGHGLKLGYYAQEHETLDAGRSVMENFRSANPDLPEPTARRTLGSFLFTGESVEQMVGTLSGGEKTRLALAILVVSQANVLLLDEPTNNLDPASRDEVLAAISAYRGALVLVTHDEGAVRALSPERVILLPDGVEDNWSDDLIDLISLA